MKKFLTKLFIALIIVPGLLSSLNVNIATAQVQTLDPESAYQANPPAAGSATTPTTAGQKAGDADSKGSNGKAEMKTQGCIGLTAGFPTSINLDACIANIVYIIMWLFSWLLWIAGKILDMSVYYTLHMSELLKHVPVVDIGWKIFRDLANIMFIFILLWTAISTILGLSSGKTKEIIEHLIIVALLMNFSLFMTKVVIDGSNIIALHFYNLIVTTEPAPNGNWTQSAVTWATPTSSFSGAFMEGLKIQTIYDPQTSQGKELANERGFAGNLAGQVLGELLNMPKIILIGIFAIVLMMTAAYVFLVAAILFMIRLVVLMMIMILSPLAFLGFVLPSTEHYAEEWLEKLLSQSFFAPIYMALCYVVVKTIQSPAFTSVISVNREDTAMSAVGIFTGNGSASGFAFIFNFILLIGLMVASILVAHKLEAVGVEFADETGKEARAMIGRGVMRGKYAAPMAKLADKVGISSGIQGIGNALKKSKYTKNWGERLDRLGENMKTEHGRASIQKSLDVNEWDRKFGRSKRGTTELGDFVRSKTTGGKLFGTGATFGGEESVGEAYEHAEHLHDKALDVERAEEVKRAALELRSAESSGERKRKTDQELLDSKPSQMPTVTDPTTGLMRPMNDTEWLQKAKETEDLRLKTLEDKIKQLRGAVQTAVTRLPSTGLIHLQEEVIHTVIPFATEKQVDELVKSTDGGWTMHDKEEFLEAYFEELKNDSEQLQKEVDEAETKKLAYEQEVRNGRFQIDSKTGEVVIDNKGRAVHRGATLDQDGNAPEAQSTAIPEFDSDKSEAYRKVYAKLRRYMSDKGFELLNITKFHYSPETQARLQREGKRTDDILLRSLPIVGQIMKWGTVQNIRDPNKTSGYTDQFRVEIRGIKDATLVDLLNKKREQKDANGNYLYRNTDDERATAIATGDLSILTKDILWEERMRDFLSGRSANESVNTPGGLRKQYEYSRFMGAEALMETAKKDPVDVTILLENVFTALKEHEEGRRIMSVENQQLLRQLIQTKEGWKIGQKMKNPEFQKMRELLEKKFREEHKSIQFTDWSDDTQRQAAINGGLKGRFSSLPSRSV